MIPKKGETTWPAEAEAELLRLWPTGMSGAEIGRRIGMTKNAVLGRAHRLQLPDRQTPIHPKVVTEADKAAVIECIANGLSIKRTMAATGVSERSVQLIRHGRPTPVLATKPKVIPAYRQPKPAPVPPVIVAPEPIVAPPPPRPVAEVIPFEGRWQCQWLHGEERRNYRQCEAMALGGANVRTPHSYCAEHRRAAYVRRSEVAA